eukprot:1140831-Rhodomonas_salina.2
MSQSGSHDQQEAMSDEHPARAVGNTRAANSANSTTAGTARPLSRHGKPAALILTGLEFCLVGVTTVEVIVSIASITTAARHRL